MTEARLGSDGLLRLGRDSYPAAIGRAGIVTRKLEGDGATPAGRLPLRRVLYRADRIARPAAATPIEPIAPDDGWCDDPHHRDYNRAVILPHPASSESLWRRDGLYDLVGILGWNDAPVVRGLGSAIFLHVRPTDQGPTEGCVALSLADLRAALAQGLSAIVIEA